MRSSARWLPVIPDRVTAGWNNLLCSLSSGLDPRRGDTYVDILFMGLKGGSGATSDCDGYDHIGMIDASGAARSGLRDVRAADAAPAGQARVCLTDSAGAGRFRGGSGRGDPLPVGGEDTQLVVFGDGDVEPAFGLFGGGPGTLNKIELHRPGRRPVYATTSKDLIEGGPGRDTLYVQEAGGGGGFGPPGERPPSGSARGGRDGLISLEAPPSHSTAWSSIRRRCSSRRRRRTRTRTSMAEGS